MRRRRARRRSPNGVEVPDLTLRADYSSVKVTALRLMVAALTEDDDIRQARLYRELSALHVAGGLEVVFAVCGHLLAHVTDGLERGYGGNAGAVDAVTRELALAVLAASKDGGNLPPSLL